MAWTTDWHEGQTLEIGGVVINLLQIRRKTARVAVSYLPARVVPQIRQVNKQLPEVETNKEK